MKPPSAPNLPSYELNVSTIPARICRYELQADDRERAAIAIACAVEAVDRFEVALDVKRWHRDGIAIAGSLAVEYTQQCVVTLETINQTISGSFNAKMVPEHSKISRPDYASDGELIVDYEAEDLPETFPGDTIDLWEIAIEFFNLEVDPFPRLDGASLESLEVPMSEEPEESPFVALKALKNSKT